jgi:hypothetical protein
VNDPVVLEASVRVIVADDPSALIATLDVVMAGGTNAGAKENVAPVRLAPVALKVLTVPPWKTTVGLIDEMTGV